MPINTDHHHELLELLSKILDIDKDKSIRQHSVDNTEKILQNIPFISYITLLSDTPQCIYFSDTAATILGHQPDAMLGLQFWLSNLHPHDKTRTLNQIETNIDAGQGTAEYRINTIENVPVWILDQHKTVQLDDKSTFIIGTWADITYLKSKSSVLNSHVDPLTGLFNREGMQQHINQLVEINGHETQHLLCHINIDQFKIINNSYGMQAGDELLRQLARILKSSLSRRDTLSRLHGDAYAILLEDCALEQGNKILDRIQESVHEFRYQWQGKSLAVTTSIGVIPINGTSVLDTTNILMLAEGACQIAKEKGRNRIEIISNQKQFENLDKQHEEMQWVERINRALEEDRFYLYYQPIVSLNPEVNERHFELLIRMKNEAGELIAPGMFLPAVEKYHLSTKIDHWVIATALSWLEAYSDILDNNISWGINLSGQSLADADLRNFVLDQFERKQVLHNKVYFEVTETAAIANLDNAITFIKALHEKGCKAALDDFGSGLSSFAYLKNLPVDYIKIDGIFIKNILEDKIDHAMVTAIKDVAISMGKKTIAEFVENVEIMDMVQSIGVDFAQGYGIDKPRPLSEFTKSENLL